MRSAFSEDDPSPLDRPLRLTIFPDKYAATQDRIRISAREFAEQIPQMLRSSKGQLPYVKYGTFGDEESRNGSLRHNANMQKIHGIEADYDGEEMSVAWALAKLDDAGIAAVLSTTASHRPDAPRYRIFCPTSRALKPEQRTALMARLNGVMDGKLAGESFALSQAFYYGAVKGRPTPRVEIVEGMAVDLAEHLDAKARGKDGKPYPLHARGEKNGTEAPELTPEDVARIRSALDAIPVEVLERYSVWLEKVGMPLHHAFQGHPDGMMLWDGASQWCSSYDPDELERKWDSFGSYSGPPVTIGTLIALAKEHGWKSPRKAMADGSGPRFISTEDCSHAAAREYVVKGILTRGDVACIFGEPGAGKSLIAPFICYQVALGETAFGMRTKQGTVFYVAAEDGYGMQGRVRALAQRQGDTPSFQLIDGISDLSEDGDDLEWLLAQIIERGPSLIVIDTLAIAFPGLEENDAASMRGVVAVGRKLAEHGTAVIFIHHGTKADGSTPRGHSVFNAALDVSMHLAKADDQGVIRGTLKKNKRGTTQRDIAFRIRVEDFGSDDDGDPITSAVAEELTGNDALRRPRMSAQQRAALEVLEGLEDDEGTVTLERWAEVASDGFHVSTSPNLKSRQTALRRACKALAELGLIKIDGRGNVRITHPSELEEAAGI
jgi:RecA/RadA recombinase